MSLLVSINSDIYSLRPIHIKRNQKGQFKRKGIFPNLTGEIIGGAILLGIVGGIVVDIMGQPVVYIKEAVAFEEKPPKEVRIEIVYDLSTEEKIINYINKVFPEEPRMVKVAKCESDYKVDAFNPTNNSDDKGVFQISTLYHGERVETLGLDMNNPKENIDFARILYDESGLQPWNASRNCWMK